MRDASNNIGVDGSPIITLMSGWNIGLNSSEVMRQSGQTSIIVEFACKDLDF